MVVNMGIEEEKIKKIGKIGQHVDPSLDLVEEINKLKKEKNAVILAHYYQDGEIQDIADFVGDSLGLSQQAAATDAEMIVFAGVHFMAETAKILNPGKKVLLPDLRAGCSLSDSCPPKLFKLYKDKYPDHTVISYINCSAEIKAMSDIICTSSNARHIVDSLPVDEPIIFAPDRNLGAYINKVTGRSMRLWNGACMVHELFSLEKMVKLRERNPGSKIIAHPECESAILDIADFIGSTSEMLRFSAIDDCNTFIVVTEAGILHKMQLQSPGKLFIASPPDNTCSCNDCPHMKLNTLEKLYLCLLDESPEIYIDPLILEQSRIPIDRMLKLSVSVK